MKALFFKNPTPDKNSFVMQEEKGHFFYNKLHYHPEIQITLILKGKGTCFVGSSITTFAPNDIFILGPDLPHVFRCNEEYFKKGSKLRVHCLSVYFYTNSFGDGFFDLPETKKINKLLKDSSMGIVFSGKTKTEASEVMIKMKEQQGFEKLSLLFKLIRLLSESTRRKLISVGGYNSPLGDENNKRMTNVYNYLRNNYQNKINLEEIAKVANMSVTSLCRFFKQRTKKTIFRLLSEIRVEHACKMLDERKYKVSDIAYECGYNNISNFNRQFLLVTGLSPRKYITRLESK